MAEPSLFAAIERYYTSKFLEHGPCARGVDWNSPESQELRFSQLLRVVDDDGGFSLVDYGCGYGALVQFLDDRGLDYTYCGFDLSEPMVDHARQELGEPGRRDFISDVKALKARDYAVASGIFNVRLSVDAAPWLAYVLETVEQLNALGTRGFAFNMLTSYSDADQMRSDLYYGDPCFFFDHCKRHFSPNIALLHDYKLFEFTIVVRK
jgi:SAM-dependent methyltransferase